MQCKALSGPIAVVTLSLCASVATGQIAFQFVIDPARSGLDAAPQIWAETNGTLIGDWDELNNPEGTRTKPGIFGSFGPTENHPVNVEIGLRIEGPVESATSGTFRLDLRPAQNAVVARNFVADYLHSGPVELPARISMLFQSFRTRSPDSTYIGGFPLELPIGEVVLSRLIARQIGSAEGELTPAGENQYDFAVAMLVELDTEFELLGDPYAPEPIETLWTLAGRIVIDGFLARITSVIPIEVEVVEYPGEPLPQFPLDLPTVLPPGYTAHLLMDLVLEEIGLSVVGDWTLDAAGRRAPIALPALR